VGTDDPLDFESNDPAAMLEIIQEKIIAVNTELAKNRNPDQRFVLMQALSALIYLRKYYQEPIVTLEDALGFTQEVPMQPDQQDAQTDTQDNGKPRSVERRVRSTDIRNPSPDEAVKRPLEDKRNISAQDRDNRPQ
jgi:hypothetical protein